MFSYKYSSIEINDCNRYDKKYAVRKSPIKVYTNFEIYVNYI